MATRQAPTIKQSTQLDSKGRQLTGLKRKPFFYDSQIKRMIVQVLANFAGYLVRTGVQRDGMHKFLDVPIVYGGFDKAVAYLLQGGSENTVPYLPIMSLIDTGYRQKSEWRQQPQHVEKLQFIERARDADDRLIVGQPGKRKIVERFQPVPYDLTFELAMWTSNKDQALQLIEQIGVVFNPEIDIMLSNSIADWSFLTTLNFDGEIRIESVIADGTASDSMMVHSMTFTTVLWLSPPVKVYETKSIQTIIVPILDLERNEVGLIQFDDLEELDRVVIKADEDDVLRFESFG